MSTALPYIPFPTDQDLAQHTSFGPARRLWTPGSFDYKVFEDGFWGDALLGLYPDASTDTGTVTFTEHNLNGYIEFKTTAANDKYAGQGVGLQWSGDQGVLGEFLVKMPATITTMKFEVGFSDADDIAGVVLQKATTSTVTATDGAVFVFDTDDDTNIGFVSAKASTTVETQDIAALVASKTYRFAVRIEGDSVSAYIDGTEVAGHANGIEGGTAITPWVFCQARDSSERIIQLHRWRVISPAY